MGFGNFTVSPHGLGIAFGYFIGTIVLTRRARARGFDEDHAWNAASLSVVGGIVGARLAYVVGNLSSFESPVEWLQVYKGGISIIGGLLGGFLAGYLYCRKKGLNFLQLSDLGAPGIAIGTAIGRIGDLAIGDHLGKQTSGWWGWEYKGGELISPPQCIYDTVDTCIRQGVVVHQTALYDSVWSLVIFGLLMKLDKKRRRTGFLTLTWAALYASGRILTDFARVDETRFGLGLTGSQLTSIIVLVVCLYFLYRGRGTAPEVLPEAPAGMGPEKQDSAKAVPAAAPEMVEPARRTRTTVLDPEEKPAAAGAVSSESPATRVKEESVFKAAREQREKARREGKPATPPPPRAKPAPQPEPKKVVAGEPTGEAPKPEPPKKAGDGTLEDEFDWET